MGLGFVFKFTYFRIALLFKLLTLQSIEMRCLVLIFDILFSLDDFSLYFLFGSSFEDKSFSFILSAFVSLILSLFDELFAKKLTVI